jgi:hypothetical protein
MRTNHACALTLLSLLTATLVGCASSASKEPVYPDVPPASASLTNSVKAAATAESAAAPATSAAASSSSQLIVTPDDTLEGSVVSVNDAGRFVVLKFPVGRIPAPDSTLMVYRQGAKVGELKVTGPQKDDHIVADIREGECRVADVVRDR